MKAKVKWLEDLTFLAQSGTGHSVVMDANETVGSRPMELLLMGMGGCSVYDVVAMLKKSRQTVYDCVVAIDSERSDTVPKVFTSIYMHYTITGKNISESYVKRAISLSTSKYCSAAIMLAKTATIRYDYRLINV